jgi:hypothetical protein|uniref:Methionine aminopeptidase n=1 Tax=uncultured bacterium UPO68_UPO87 TaxID=1776988 RepID=A0A126SZ06_9BACT|nr:methionine aminopeptidase [uncultured bacterium UPO68_UPO87]
MTISSESELEGLRAIGRNLADPCAPTVQYEHSLVVTKNGPVILTLA